MLLRPKHVGSEIDFVVQGSTDALDLDDRILIFKGNPPRALDGPDPSSAELSAHFGIGALEDADASWTADERRMLATALELLSPEELALVAEVSFTRARHRHSDRGERDQQIELGDGDIGGQSLPRRRAVPAEHDPSPPAVRKLHLQGLDVGRHASPERQRRMSVAPGEMRSAICA